MGAVFGAFVMLVNGFLSPVGFGGLNIPFQVVGMMIAALVGGAYRRYTRNTVFRADFFFETALLGAVIALIYDVITNVGFALQLILTGDTPALALFTSLAYGSWYSLLHVVSNAVVFGVLFIPVTKALNNLKVGESLWSRKEQLPS
jgi:hypothetical protein